MVFSSPLFLFRFLPAVLLLYAIVPSAQKNMWKNLVLFVASLIFYAWGEPVYVVLMLFSTVVDYVNGGLTGYFMGRGNKSCARIFLALSVVINLSLLFVFKYSGFFVNSWNAVTGMDLAVRELPLPIGISFYTFQTMSYTIDIYRGDAKPEKNIISFGCYVAMFPQLIAGPIVRFKDISLQLKERVKNTDHLSYGALRFTVGLGKKVLLANNAGVLFETFTSYEFGQMSMASSFGAVLFFAFQIYFDFSGYSDMAIGLMSIFGFSIPENFDYPYISKSITEFWRRWHISLGTWFREYVYIPLGGNRKGLYRTFFNMFFVWFLTGFWHGAAVNFILWGLYFWLFLMLEKWKVLAFLEKLPKAAGHIYALVVLYFSFLLFAWEDIGGSHRAFLGAMAGMAPGGIITREAAYQIWSNLVLLIVLVVGSTPFPKKVAQYLCRKDGVMADILKTVFIVAVFLLSVAYLVNASYNPFLYFRF